MSTTDRMSDLNSQRTATDRVGDTVILGNAVAAGSINESANIVAACAGASRASVPFDMDAISTLTAYNGSFGIWAVFWNPITSALLRNTGAAIAAGRFSDTAAGLLAWGAEGALLNIQVKTATGTYTPTTGTVRIIVEALGAGGGGGGAEATGVGEGASGGGGGAGALAIGIITSGFSGVTVTIGAGGAGGAAGLNNGAVGGTTSFGSVLFASGGQGGTGDEANPSIGAAGGGTGGAASGTASLFGADGQNGAQGWFNTTNLTNPGAGGSTIYGSGGYSSHSSVNTTGVAATGFGAGGSGGGNVENQATGKAGGNGAPGLVIIYEFNA